MNIIFGDVIGGALVTKYALDALESAARSATPLFRANALEGLAGYHEQSDTLIFWATSPGNVSTRLRKEGPRVLKRFEHTEVEISPLSGTFFLLGIYRVFTDMASTDELMDILREVGFSDGRKIADACIKMFAGKIRSGQTV